MNERVDEWMDRRMDGRTDGWMYGRTDGRIDGWMNEERKEERMELRYTSL